MKLKGKVAVITGAGSGRGMSRGFPEGFAKEGCNLSLNIYGEDAERVAGFVRELEGLRRARRGDAGRYLRGERRKAIGGEYDA